MTVHDAIRTWWDADAATYDASAGHAMTDPVETATWAAALTALLPPAPVSVLDAGAGTGAMTLLAARLGYRVTGVDLSDAMLAHARRKAEEAGLEVAFVHGPAEEPPAGPFAAVIERHVLWTLPDPVVALTAWRSVTESGGRLILFEGSWAGDGPLIPVRDAAARALERVLGIEDDHHAPYPEDIIRAAPLAALRSPRPILEAVDAAGWHRIRLIRLRDIEWAIDQRTPWPLGVLTSRPRYAVVAEA